jgi:hypothetical protein
LLDRDGLFQDRIDIERDDLFERLAVTPTFFITSSSHEGYLHVFIGFEHKNAVQTIHPNPPDSLRPMT